MAAQQPGGKKPPATGTRSAKGKGTRRASTGSSEGTRDSSDIPSTPPPATPSNPLGLEPDEFVPPDGPTPADDNVDLLDYEPPPPELVEWTPERAGSIVRAGGFLLHIADPFGSQPEGEALWKATEDDVEQIAPPLARILNRYEPARRLAGLSDEGELAFGMIAYARRNLVERGRVVRAVRERAEAAETTAETWPLRPDEPPPAS